ncbi:MAG: hypothetical protein IKQ31_03115 [Clostridia bacterium]|nr:hypothetical protein [Clostridia bacterium]
MQKVNHFVRTALAVLVLLVASLPMLIFVGCKSAKAQIEVIQVFEQDNPRTTLTGYGFIEGRNQPVIVTLTNSTEMVKAEVSSGVRGHSYQCDTAYVTKFVFDIKKGEEYKIGYEVPEGYYLSGSKEFSFTTRDLVNNYKAFYLVFHQGTKTEINGHTVTAPKSNIVFNNFTNKYEVTPQTSFDKTSFVCWQDNRGNVISKNVTVELEASAVTEDLVLYPISY